MRREYETIVNIPNILDMQNKNITLDSCNCLYELRQFAKVNKHF
jgi:hypothetical protein